MRRTPLRRWAAALPTLFVALGCTSSEPPSATLVLMRGKEPDAFTRDPRPTRLIINGISPYGGTEQLMSRSWPTGGFDVGDFDTGQTVAFEARGLDATGATVLRGATIFHDLWAIDGTELPVFMGRTKETSRPSGDMMIARRGGEAALVAGRFIVHAGGEAVTDAAGEPSSPAVFGAYDLGAWRASAVAHELPRAPRSLVVVLGQFGLLIDDAGATWFDFASYDAATAIPPEGMSFAEVSGGDVVYGPSAEAYVVGATRSVGPASDAVLRVGPEGTLTALRTHASRRRASAAWVTDRGLVVVAGNPQAPGVELLAEAATAFADLPMPPDGTEGLACVALDDRRLVLAGGLRAGAPAPTRVLDVSCLEACAPTELANAGPVAIAPAHAFVVRADEVLVVGDDASIATDPPTILARVTGLDATPSVVAVPLREARVGAVPLAIYGRAVALVGGLGPHGTPIRGIEIFIPE